MPEPPDRLADLLTRAVAAYRVGRLADAEALSRQAVAASPNSFDALHLLAIIETGLGRNAAALADYDRALALRPDHADAIDHRGIALLGLRRFAEAQAQFDRALALRPGDPGTLNNRGSALHGLGRFDDALASYDRALALRPDHADAHSNRGLTLASLRRDAEALASYDRALALRPDHVQALYNRGNALKQVGRDAEALASYDRALAARPDHADALYNRGLALHALKRLAEAVASYERALAARPDYAEAYNDRGIALHEMARYDEALDSFNRALTLRPDYAEAFNNRGIALHDGRRLAASLADFDRALALRPDYHQAFSNRGNVLAAMDRHGDALACYDRAIALRPDYDEAWVNRGDALRELWRFAEAMASYERALALKPGASPALSGLADCAIHLCDWEKRAAVDAALPGHLAAPGAFIAPFTLMAYRDDPAMKLRSTRNFVANGMPFPPAPMPPRAAWRNERIRVAYLSADFRTHAGAFLIAGLIEAHDRARFEILGISFGPDDGSAMRKRLGDAFDRFHDVRERSDHEIARLLYDLRVDIAIDRNGHTRHSRPGILARRPAPIQTAFLGYPGSSGMDAIDYIIADRIVAPFEHRPHYAENIVHLPHSYQATDNKRRIADTPSRAEAGLPARGFVFCCFNNSWKITPALFDVWMRLLGAVEGSVLWLLHTEDGTEQNLRAEARQRGIDPVRLVFAARLPQEAHLARQRLADLFLDTLPYNAHTTASDALWVGLPVVTCLGATFAARVAASVLQAVGLPDLVTVSLADYEALALRLAREPGMLAEIKARLQHQRDTHPLFDTPRYARHIEAAYATMWEIWQRGEAPHSFSVAPIDP
jgi:predicted O-linked N-acetylglucosamine transferase (SPINDLY family)